LNEVFHSVYLEEKTSDTSDLFGNYEQLTILSENAIFGKICNFAGFPNKSIITSKAHQTKPQPNGHNTTDLLHNTTVPRSLLYQKPRRLKNWDTAFLGLRNSSGNHATNVAI